MNLRRAIFTVSLLAFTIPTLALACTGFQLRSKDGAYISFRSMEYGIPLHSKIAIVPRGTAYVGTAPNGKPGIAWKTTYGMVGMNAAAAPSIITDGMNEKGLVVSSFYLPGFAQYLPPSDARQADTLGSWEVGSYLLSTCATADEAVAALTNTVWVAQQDCAALGIFLPLHYLISDASGTVKVAEYIGGQLHIHDNPVGVLTNSPSFDWHLTNLSNFVNLSPLNVATTNVGNLNVPSFGQGSGFIGIPGDYTPPSRFVRAALYSHWATLPASASDTVNLGFHVLNTFDIFEGAIQQREPAATAAPAPSTIVNTDITEWQIAHDRTNLVTYFRMYGGQEIQKVDLRKIDFTLAGIREIAPRTTFAPTDVTATAQPLASH